MQCSRGEAYRLWRWAAGHPPAPASGRLSRLGARTCAVKKFPPGDPDVSSVGEPQVNGPLQVSAHFPPPGGRTAATQRGVGAEPGHWLQQLGGALPNATD